MNLPLLGAIKCLTHITLNNTTIRGIHTARVSVGPCRGNDNKLLSVYLPFIISSQLASDWGCFKCIKMYDMDGIVDGLLLVVNTTGTR